ncbi:MAG: hypothetical protein K2X94_03515 [Amoebophilaceae bacterium]|nr:hypothetical protein [Amoebophilaceae bacterium]
MQKIHSLSLLLFTFTASVEGFRNQDKNSQPSPPLNTDLQAIQTNSSNIVNAKPPDSTTQASSSDIAPEKPIATEELPRVEDIAPESIPNKVSYTRG